MFWILWKNPNSVKNQWLENVSSEGVEKNLMVFCSFMSRFLYIKTRTENEQLTSQFSFKNHDHNCLVCHFHWKLSNFLLFYLKLPSPLLSHSKVANSQNVNFQKWHFHSKLFHLKLIDFATLSLLKWQSRYLKLCSLPLLIQNCRVRYIFIQKWQARHFFI